MGLLGHSSSASSSCTPLPASDYQAQPIAGTWSFHKLITVASAGLGGFAIFICLVLGLMHLRYYCKPAEQRQLVRIINVPVIYAIFSFVAVAFYDSAGYVVPIADLYECFAVVAIFYYMITIVSPDESNRESFFEQLELREKGKAVQGGSLSWFSKQWFAVFQLLPGRIITTIATWAVTAHWHDCPSYSRLRTCLIVINVVNAIQMVLAILAILRVYARLKPQLNEHHLVSKLAVLKGIIGVLLVQRAVFSGLIAHGDLHASAQISYMDWTLGIPNFLVLAEMALAAPAFAWAYGWRQYSHAAGGETRGFLRAFVDVWNVLDVLGGILYAFELRSRVKRLGSYPSGQVEQVQVQAVRVAKPYDAPPHYYNDP